MTLFVSVPLFVRDGRLTYSHPRKEASDTSTQAKKAAARFWRNAIQEPAWLSKVLVTSVQKGVLAVSERVFNPKGGHWVGHAIPLAEAAQQPHLAACMAELGVDLEALPPRMPDVLEINGVIYRREI